MTTLKDTDGYGPNDFDAIERSKFGDTGGVENAVFTEGRRAWHGVGMVLDADVITAEEALRHAKLGDWDLRKFPLFTQITDDDGAEDYRQVVITPGSQSKTHAVVRMQDRHVLGLVGERYHIVTNEECFAWADALVGGDGAHYKTAGSLYGGRIVWLQLEVPFKVDLPDSEYCGYLYLSTSHDGSSGVEAGYWNERICCRNTLNFARGGGRHKFSIRHTESAKDRLAEAQRVLGLAQGAAERASQIAEQLFARKITRKQVDKTLETLFPVAKADSDVSRKHAQDKRDAVLALYGSEKLGAPQIMGTAWGMWNALTAYTTQSLDTAKTPEQAQRLFDSIMQGNTVADRALEMLVATK